MKIPFSVYDFFGYLAGGFLVCTGVDLLVGQHWIFRDEFPLPYMGLLVTAAYIVGHINASFASFFLERLAVGKLLGRPHTVLFGEGPKSRLTCLFPGYYTQLSPGVQERVLERVGDLNLKGADLFHHVRSLVKRDTATMTRVDTFLHLYGFCRNTSFSLIATGIALGTYAWLEENPPANLGWYAIASAGAGVGMFYRYLKFFRLYSYEMFNAYPDLPRDA